jgi:FAD/FMN-containing dehydrogenase
VLSEGDYVDHSFRIFSSEREIRFTEMEYAIPRAHGPEAVRRVLEWISTERYPVAFPIECRVAAPDDALLSPAQARETFYVAVHQYRGMEWRPYFEAVESIMGEYGGRPHWGKRHGLNREALADRYPRFSDFLAVRERLDPQRVFASDYTRRRLGE